MRSTPIQKMKVASLTPGTCSKWLWLLPSGPDQVHHPAMRGDPPRRILTQGKACRLVLFSVCRLSLTNTKPPLPVGNGGLNGESGVDLLSRARCSLSLARCCFTVLFGMGRGGTSRLLTPDVTCMLIVVETLSAKWGRLYVVTAV